MSASKHTEFASPAKQEEPSQNKPQRQVQSMVLKIGPKSQATGPQESGRATDGRGLAAIGNLADQNSYDQDDSRGHD